MSILRDSLIENLNGLENSTSLYKLIANNCNIEDITGLDHLDKNGSYIGKLSYLDLEYNSNLKNVLLIAKCGLIRNLYLEGNEQMIADDVKSLESIIKLCGQNYSLPKKYRTLFSTTIDLDFSDLGLTDESFEISSIKGRTDLQWLRLYGNNNLAKSRLANLIKEGILKFSELDKILENLSGLSIEEKSYIESLKSIGETSIKELSDEQIIQREPKESDIYFRYVLSTLTGLKKLSVAKITNLTKIDFLNTVKGLEELDYRSTNITDVSLLNENALSLNTLYTNGAKTDLSTIQVAMENIYSNDETSGSGLKCCWSNKAFNDVIYGGLNIEKYEGWEDAFIGCSELKKLKIGGFGGGEFDLSYCSKLDELYLVDDSAKLPAHSMKLVRIYWHGGYVDGSACPAIETLRFGEYSPVNNIIWSSLSNTEINIVDVGSYIGGCSFNDIALLQGSKDSLTGIKGRYAYSSYYYQDKEVGNVGCLSDFKKLNQIIYSGSRRSDIVTGIENLTSLTVVYLRSNDISDISGFHNLTLMKEMRLDDNKISSLYCNDENGNEVSIFENMEKLETLELSTNQIEDLSGLECLLNFRDENGKMVLKNLNIKNNSLERYSVSGYDNLGLIQKFIEAGCSVSYDESDFQTN